MSYFIIPTSSGLVSTNTTIYFDNGLSISNTPNKKVMKFGDGYSLSIPLSPLRRDFNFSLSNREPATINLVESYFKFLQALVNESTASKLINGLNIFDRNVNGELLSFNKIYSRYYESNGAYTISGSIREVFR
jgi:hypothetical protein